MKQFHVTGMSCAACQTRVERAVSKVEGVSSCSVSLLTNSMGVEGDATDTDIIRAVQEAGYGAAVQDSSTDFSFGAANELADHETPRLKRRLLWSLLLLGVLLYFSMGQMLLHLPLPHLFSNNPLAIGMVQLLLTLAVMGINNRFFRSGFKSLLHRAPNMDTLVALGSSASFIWSVYALFRMGNAQMQGGSAAAMPWMQEFYFESAAMILTLITVGKMLEARSKGKTTDALRALMKLAPQTATVIRGGEEQTIPVKEAQTGEIFVVRPGESIPVDGIILEGSTAVNESALTGESIPTDKSAGDAVSAATINQSGYIRCRATRVGEDTTLSQIIQMVSDAASTKAPIAKIADRISGIFVPVVIGIAAVTLCVWLLLGKPTDFALARAISVLVISCPCALGLATPVAIMVGSGVGAKHGILFKTAESLETTGKVQIVVLDKTGTVTRGEPTVTKLIPANDINEEELLRAAYALERKSEHPLARAVVREAELRGITAEEVSDFRALSGNGLTATQNGAELCGGSMQFISAKIPTDTLLLDTANNLADAGSTPLFFTKNGELLGVIAVADTLKEESPASIAQLKEMGLQVVLLTGDNTRTAQAVGNRAGIFHVIAGVLPNEKEAVIRKLQTLGAVAMVGDGINDAPALTAADMGIAIGAGTDVAIDAANIVLMNSKLSDVPTAIRLSRATLTNIRQNLFWAFFYNIIGIPLAAGCFTALLGWQLNPMFGAAAMSLSSFCVVSNALRLNLFDISAVKGGRKPSNPVSDTDLRAACGSIIKEKEAKRMTKTMKIEGMMCGHCEARVKNVLEAMDGVISAEVSHENGTAIVKLSKDVADDTLKAAVEAQDYTVCTIQ